MPARIATPAPDPDKDLDTIAKLLAPHVAPHVAALLNVEHPQGATPETDQEKADRERASGLISQGMSKSAVMRELWAGGEGWTRSRIAKALGVRYQFVYNQTS
jgi:hypothetical protein